MESQDVYCDGKSDESPGHPKIYLKLKAKEVVICPYCSREFFDNKEYDHEEFS